VHADRNADRIEEWVVGNVSGLRASDAFSQALRAAPVLANDEVAWGGIAVCDWDLPWVDGFDLEENNDFIVAYHSAGSRTVRAACNGPWGESVSVPGLISVIPPGRRVNYRIDGQVSFCSIHVPSALLEGLLTSAFPVQPYFRFAFEDVFARSCIEILLNHARRAPADNFPYVHAVTRALLLHLMEAFRQSQPRRAFDAAEKWDETGVKLDAMLDMIDSRLGEPLTLDGMAKHVDVSRAHFVRRFRAVTGVSPHRYLTMRRIEKAKQLLRDSCMPLSQIGLNVGFGSQSHFTQVFHAETGHPPSQYRALREPGPDTPQRG
jgi:AraC family transcriptional regulator